MDPAKQRAIAVLGGKAAQASGVGHRWTLEQAHAAGQKGGLTTAARRKAQRKAEKS